jgi:hypothetical protein
MFCGDRGIALDPRIFEEAASVGKQGHPTAEEFREQVGISGPLRQALEISEECGFTPEQLERYDAFWDAVSRERTLMSGKFAEGHAEGETKGLLKAAAGMKALGLDSAAIAQATGLPLEGARNCRGRIGWLPFAVAAGAGCPLVLTRIHSRVIGTNFTGPSRPDGSSGQSEASNFL